MPSSNLSSFRGSAAPKGSVSGPFVLVLGAGVAGLTVADALAAAGCRVELVERAEGPGRGCSHVAGGMLAPWCEAESAEPLIAALGEESLAFWRDHVDAAGVPVATMRGSLVVAPARDRPDLMRFARRTRGFETLGGDALAALEPDLAGRFTEALYFPGEAHLDPRAATAALARRLAAQASVTLRFGVKGAIAADADWTIDCRGLAARDALPELRGVKGEMAVLRTREVSLSRPVRLLHPRHPVYIVPRGDGRFMVGATTIESEAPGVTARALLELLGAAYAVHPAFGEAEVIETGADLRPAFPDNLPRLVREGRTLYVNGLYRHGFLLAPALAWRAAEVVTKGAIFPELMDEHHRQRKRA